MRSLVQLTLVAALATLGPATAASHTHGVTVSTTSNGPVRSCSDLEMTFDGEPAATAVDNLTAAGGGALSIEAPNNGGVYVFGSAGRADFAISACKGVALRVGTEATAALAQIRPALNGRTVTATGPEPGDWVVFFIVNAPASAAVNVETTNGPVHVEQISGSTTARAINGPIKLLDVSGRASARAVNGPVAYEGHGGTVELHTDNGPIKVRLAGDRWASGSLTATAQNGPLAVEVPRGFHSGVRISSSNHSPWKCRGCDDGRKTWDNDSRSIEIGSGPVAVTLSTVNGPVAVDRGAPN
jgi:hypothetical protein